MRIFSKETWYQGLISSGVQHEEQTDKSNGLALFWLISEWNWSDWSGYQIEVRLPYTIFVIAIGQEFQFVAARIFWRRKICMNFWPVCWSNICLWSLLNKTQISISKFLKVWILKQLFSNVGTFFEVNILEALSTSGRKRPRDSHRGWNGSLTCREVRTHQYNYVWPNDKLLKTRPAFL